MRILITGSRAATALEWTRRLANSGHQVYLADSFCNGLATRSRYRVQSFVTPPVRYAPQAFLQRISEIVGRHKIDRLVPTCEEVFYLAAGRKHIGCEVFCDSLEQLRWIHDKWQFAERLRNAGAPVPETHLLKSPSQLAAFRSDAEQFVFKPCFSRFASRTQIGQPYRVIRHLPITEQQPWVAQKRILGTEYSSYSIAHQGQMTAHVSYRSRYHCGIGSGIYFEPLEMPGIRRFVESFLQEHSYTGQIGFDFFIESDRAVSAHPAGFEPRIWVIEGNPRATSGVHLFPRDRRLAEALIRCRHTGSNRARAVSGVVEPDYQDPPKMLAGAMPFWGLQDVLRRNPEGNRIRSLLKFVGDFFSAQDVLMRWNDPLPMIAFPATLAEVLWKAFRHRVCFSEAATMDNEWNGQ